MENKSITELTELIIKSIGMIERKNEHLRHASEEFRNVGKLATMCKGMKFTTAESASEFMGVMANTLQKLSYERFDLLEESNIALPEAVEAEEDTVDKDGAVDDLPFVTPDKEVEA